MAIELMNSTLRQAFERASQTKIPIILASTTGTTAEEMLHVIGAEKAHLIIVSHDSCQIPREWRFSDKVIEQLKERGFPVLKNYPVIPFPIQLLRRLAKTFKISTTNFRDQVLEETLGTGGRVCFQITRLALKAYAIHENDVVVAIAGERSGANTALLLKIESTRPVCIRLLETIGSFKSNLLRDENG